MISNELRIGNWIEIKDSKGICTRVTESTFDSNIEKDAFKSARKYLHILPSVTQTSIEIGEESESAENIVPRTLGYANDLVWDKKFKIRVRSKSTGKLIDFNVTFTKKEIWE